MDNQNQQSNVQANIQLMKKYDKAVTKKKQKKKHLVGNMFASFDFLFVLIVKSMDFPKSQINE